MKHLFSEYIDLRPKEWDIVFRVHATKRMFSRLIDSDDVLHLFSTGMVIEEYQDDFPFPSVLLNGFSIDKRPLHAVVGIDTTARRLYLITIYHPDSDKWTDDYTRRISP